MAVKTLLSANGMMLAEISGGDRTDYLTDALGSITGTVDQSGALTSTREYEPYGAVFHETGTPPTSFGWVGSLGYRMSEREKCLTCKTSDHINRWIGR